MADSRHLPPSPPDRVLAPEQAFEQLARITLADHSVESVTQKIAGLSRQTVPGAAEVSVTLVERGRATTVAFTGELARALDEQQYERGHGPCLDGIAGGEPVRIPRVRTDDRWPDWSVEAARYGAASLLTLPVPLQREVSAALNMYGVEEDAFDDEAVELARTFAASAGVALANVHLYQAQGKVAEQLQTAMQSRAVIEQAKGVLMGQRGCGADDAFDVLVRLSQNSNRKLRDVAQAVVDQAARGQGAS